jgi:hypothetical protein
MEVISRVPRKETAMKRSRPAAGILVLSAVALLTGLPGTPAQSGYPATEPAALATSEGAAYARVRQLQGAVTLFRDSEVVESMVELNTPVAAGDILETGSPGRTEVQLADGSLSSWSRACTESIWAPAAAPGWSPAPASPRS